MVTDSRPGFLGIGQATARGIAQATVRGHRAGGTLLVHGPRGAGGDEFVEDLLALLFCGAADAAPRPCNACRECRDARSRAHPDFVVGSPATWRAARTGGESIVAAARRWLSEASSAPIRAANRVVLIEHVDEANEQTQNALLKALEEPAPRQLFVLTAAEPARVLPTIRSRAQSLRLGRVPRDELVAWLVDVEQLPGDQAHAVARIADGMSGTAAGYARQPRLLDWRRRTQAELLALLAQGRAARFAAARELVAETARSTVVEEQSVDAGPADDGATAPLATAQQRAAALLVLDAWIALARDLALIATGRPGLAPSVDFVEGAEAAGAALPPAVAARAVRDLEHVRDGIEQHAAPRLAMSAAMLSWPSSRTAR